MQFKIIAAQDLDRNQRHQIANLLALMVVWDYPCESKSSPAHYSKHPNLKRGWGVFLYQESNQKRII